MMSSRTPLISILFSISLFTAIHAADAPADAWQTGTPIVTYWAGPGYPGGAALDDRAATQLAEGGWNMVWCNEKELDVAQRHGLRGLLINPLLKPAALNDPSQLEALTTFIKRVRHHPSLYAYHLIDEPSAAQFPEISKLVAYLHRLDPAHLAYINLLPTYANNKQLGIEGEKCKAYTEHLRQYIEMVKPELISYDHYQFTNSGDNPDYFLNLALIRDKSLAYGIPFLNIVQASCWVPGSAASPHAPRVPTGKEMRFLVYTTLAYGAQGISYYVYCYPKHKGGMALPDGTPTPLYHALKPLNHAFTAIAKEIQPLKSLGVFHMGMQPPGTLPLPEKSPFFLDQPMNLMNYKSGERIKGLLFGYFGSTEQTLATAGYVLVVNLDYQAEQIINLNGPGALEIFDAANECWSPAGGSRAELQLEGGGGKLVRVRP